MGEAFAYVAGGDAHDGIFTGIVGGRAVKELDADGAFFEIG
jgi:hypothetical protein